MSRFQLKINIYKHGRLGTKRSLENFKILILLLFHPLFWYDLFMIRKSDHHQKTWNDQRSGGYWTVNFVIWILNLCTITNIWVLDINLTPSFLTIHLLKVWHWHIVSGKQFETMESSTEKTYTNKQMKKCWNKEVKWSKYIHCDSCFLVWSKIADKISLWLKSYIRTFFHLTLINDQAHW